MVPEGLLSVVSAHLGCRSLTCTHVCAPVGLSGERRAAAVTHCTMCQEDWEVVATAPHCAVGVPGHRGSLTLPWLFPR